MSGQVLDHYTAQSFDEAVEKLVEHRESQSPNVAQIDLQFPMENLPEELLVEYHEEAKKAGMVVNPAA